MSGKIVDKCKIIIENKEIDAIISNGDEIEINIDKKEEK